MSSELDDLLKKMASARKGWNPPAHFAQTATRLGLRDYNFPGELEARAFVDGFGDLGLDGIGIAIDDTPILSPDEVTEAIKETGDDQTLRVFLLQAKRKDIINPVDGGASCEGGAWRTHR